MAPRRGRLHGQTLAAGHDMDPAESASRQLDSTFDYYIKDFSYAKKKKRVSIYKKKKINSNTVNYLQIFNCTRHKTSDTVSKRERIHTEVKESNKEMQEAGSPRRSPTSA